MTEMTLLTVYCNKIIATDKNYNQKMQVLTSARGTHNKENQTAEPNKELQRLKVELNDRTFELHKLEQDNAQQKAQIYIQLQKEKQSHAKIVKELKDKIKDDNQSWVRMIDAVRKEKEEALDTMRIEIEENCRNQNRQIIQDLKEKHILEVSHLKHIIAHNKKEDLQKEQKMIKEAKEAEEATLMIFRKQEQEKERKHKTVLAELKKEYEQNITKLQSIYIKEEFAKQEGEIKLQNAIKSHVREKIYWQQCQASLNMQIGTLNERIFQLQATIKQMSIQMKRMEANFQADIDQIKASNLSKIKQIESQSYQKQREHSTFYSAQIENLKIEVDKLLDIHKKKEQSWFQSGKMVLQLYQKRQSKKQDIKAIQKLEVELIKKDFLIERERKELKNCKMELENMEQIYDRIFIYNSNLSRSKVKSYQIKKLKTSCQLNQSNRSTIMSDKNIDKRYPCERNE